jgi:hypothetical protein
MAQLNLDLIGEAYSVSSGGKQHSSKPEVQAQVCAGSEVLIQARDAHLIRCIWVYLQNVHKSRIPDAVVPHPAVQQSMRGDSL